LLSTVLFRVLLLPVLFLEEKYTGSEYSKYAKCIAFIYLVIVSSQQHLPLALRKHGFVLRLEPHIHDLRGPEPALRKLGLVVTDKPLLYAVSRSRLGKELRLAGPLEADEVGGGFGGG
jgi:hypothetical protein